MPHRMVSIFVALAVVLTNSLCLCAGESALTAIASSHPPMAGHPCCSDEMPSPQSNGCPDAPAPAQKRNQTCSHCNGSAVIAPASADQSSLGAPGIVPSPLLFLTVVPRNTRELVLMGSIEHTGLPPPLDSPTLLNLGCAFNT